MLLAGTTDGLHRIDDGTVELGGKEVTALAVGGDTVLAVTDGDTVWQSTAGAPFGPVSRSDDLRINCLSPGPAGLFVGTSEAHLLRLSSGSSAVAEGSPRDELEPLAAFDEVEGRDGWYTPWGGPPDSRSIGQGSTGEVYVNVHVGGIVRSRDGGRTWEPTLDVDSDVHQVVVHPGRPRTVLAATARGLAISEDGGDTWRFFTDGLHASYQRAVTVAAEHILVSASTGPRGGRAAVYRFLQEGESFEKCSDGLPQWFQGNVDTHCLVASAGTAALGTEDGRLFASSDGGRRWSLVRGDLPAVRCLVLA